MTQVSRREMWYRFVAAQAARASASGCASSAAWFMEHRADITARVMNLAPPALDVDPQGEPLPVEDQLLRRGDWLSANKSDVLDWIEAELDRVRTLLHTTALGHAPRGKTPVTDYPWLVAYQDVLTVSSDLQGPMGQALPACLELVDCLERIGIEVRGAVH